MSESSTGPGTPHLRSLPTAAQVAGAQRPSVDGAHNAALDGTHHAVVVVGGGQAGLAVSWYLCQRGVDHLVLERDRVGYEWRGRGRGPVFPVAPNRQGPPPRVPFPGKEPDRVMDLARVVGDLGGDVASFRAPP